MSRYKMCLARASWQFHTIFARSEPLTYIAQIITLKKVIRYRCMNWRVWFSCKTPTSRLCVLVTNMVPDVMAGTDP